MNFNKKTAMQIFKEMEMFQLRDISPDNGGGPCITVQRIPGGHIYSVGGGGGRWNSVFVPETMDEKNEDVRHPINNIPDHKAFKVFKMEYDGESIINMCQDIDESMDTRFNNNWDLIPQEDGFMKGKFTVTLTWESDEEE